jgi:hypothetical protein
VGDRGQLLQSQAGVKVLLHLLDDGMELPLSERTGRSKGRGLGAEALRIRWMARRMVAWSSE